MFSSKSLRCNRIVWCYIDVFLCLNTSQRCLLAYWSLLTKTQPVHQVKWLFTFTWYSLDQFLNTTPSFGPQYKTDTGKQVWLQQKPSEWSALALWAQAAGPGLVQFEDKTALGTPNSSLPVSAGKLARTQTLVTEVHGKWMRDNCPRLKEGKFQLGPRKQRMWEQPSTGTGYPESCGGFATGVLNTWLNKALSNLV